MVGISKQKLAVLNHYDELQIKLNEIRDEKPLLGEDENINFQEQYILKQIKQIKSYLKLYT